MYRHVTLRFDDPPIPLVQATKDHRLRIIGHSLRRAPDILLAEEYLLLARGDNKALDAAEKALVAKGHTLHTHPVGEPSTRVFQTSLGLPKTGPIKGLLAVVAQSLGLILEHEPLVIENGTLTMHLVTIPGQDSAVRLQAIEQHAAAEGLGLEILAPKALTAPPVLRPPDGVLDLLEWDTLQALENAGCFDEAPPQDQDEVLKELSQSLEMPLEELRVLAEQAKNRLLQQQIRTRRKNIHLATPPRE